MTDNPSSPPLSSIRAFIRSKREGQVPQPVVLLARTGGRKNIRVREVDTNTPRTFGVYPFDLENERGQRLAPAVLDALPWQGAGADPLGGLPPVTARLPAATPAPIDGQVRS